MISTELERDTVSAVLQYQPSDSLDIVLDILSIDYSDSGVRRGIIDPFTAVNVTGGENIYQDQQVDAPRNKEAKWRAIFDNNRYLKCKGEKDIKKLKVYKICRWGTVCPHINNDVYDDGLYVGRIQVNLNNGKKRKFLYFIADYKIRKE